MDRLGLCHEGNRRKTCVGFDRNDFVGPLEPLPPLDAFLVSPEMNLESAASATLLGDSNLRTVTLPALYVPDVNHRLFSTTCLIRAYPNEALTARSWGTSYSLTDVDPLVEATHRSDPSPHFLLDPQLPFLRNSERNYQLNRGNGQQLNPINRGRNRLPLQFPRERLFTPWPARLPRQLDPLPR